MKTSRQLSGTTDSMVNQFKKATAEMIVLSRVKNKAKYVYQILKEINFIGSSSFQLITLDTTIKRLVQNEYITEIKMPPLDNRERRYFQITDSGINYLNALIHEFEILIFDVQKIMKYEGNIDE